MAVDRRPPQNVRRAAQRALDTRASLPKSRKAMVGEDGKPSTGYFTARKLISGTPVSVDLLRTMVAWFARHDNDMENKTRRKDKSRTSKAWQAWLAWGGTEGRRWAIRTLRAIERDQED